MLPQSVEEIGPGGLVRFDVEELIGLERAAGNPVGPFHQDWLLRNVAPERVQRALRRAAEHRGIMGAGQGFASLDTMRFPTNIQSAVTASATRTNLWDPTVDCIIPALDMQVGKGYNCKFGGTGTATGTQGLLTWTPSEGVSGTPASNHTYGASNVTAPAASITCPWFGEFTFGVYAVDLARTAISSRGNGYVITQGAAAATGIMYVMGGTNVTSTNNKAATGFVVDLTISVASQSYTCNWVLLRSYN